MPELNRQKRIEVRIKVNLKYPDRETFVERFSQNLSRTGIFIRASDPAPVGSRIHFEYTIGDHTRVLRGVGIVRWSRKPADAKDPDKPPGMGLEFIDVDKETEAFISQIVKDHGEGSRAPQRKAVKVAPAVTVTPVGAGAPAKPAAPLDAEEETALDVLMGAQPKPRPAPKVEAKAAAEPAAVARPPEPPAVTEPVAPAKPPETAPPPAAEPDLEVEVEAPPPAPKPVPPPLVAAEPPPPIAAAPPPSPAPDLDLDFEAPRTPPPGADEPAFDLGVETPADVDSSVLVEVNDETPEPAAARTPTPQPPLTPPVPQPMKREPTPPPDDGFVEAEAVLTEPPAPAPKPPPAPTAAAEVELTEAIIDLCGKELLIATLDSAGEVQTRRVAARLGLDGTDVRLDPNGVAVTGLVGWVGRRWPSAQVTAAARRQGLTVSRGQGGDPAIMIGATPVSLLDALGACVRELMLPLEDAPPPLVTVVVPARTHMTVTSMLKSALSATGVSEVRTVTDALVSLKATGTTLEAGQWALVIDLGVAETRVTLVQGPDTAVGTRAAVDCSLHDADELLTERAALQLLRLAGVDIFDDTALRSGVATQIGERRRTNTGGVPWSVIVAGSELEIDPSAVAQWAEPLNERVALLADALLHEHGVAAQTMKTVVLTPDEQPWPGLLEALEEALGVRPVVPEGGPLSRVRLARKT